MSHRGISEQDRSFQSPESLMQEELTEERLFVDESSYGDEDTQQGRRRSLERHSSTDVCDIPIVTILDNQLAQSEMESAKPIVSYMQSFLRSTTATVASTPSWLSGQNNRKDQRRLNLENLMKITEPAEAVEVLNRAVELKNAMYTQAALDLITHLCEQDKSKSTSASLGAEGACNVVETLLGSSLTSASLTEAALRAICSLITPVSPNQVPNAGLLPSTSGICTSSAQDGIASNRKRFSSAGSVYQIIKAAGNHISDEIVLEWGLRVIFYLSLEPGIVSRVISCGGVDLLAQSLRTHVACDAIVIWSCRTLCNCILTLDTVSPEDRTVCQNKFSQQLVLEILIHEFTERLSVLSLLAAQWILKSIGCLARRHEHNMLTFVELGVCPILQQVVAQFSLENEKIAESVCWVIGNISYPSEDAQQRWGAGGACEVVIEVLKRHVGSEETVQEALRAVRNLCYDNDANLEILRKLNVAEVVMGVIRRHQESSGGVLQWLWYAVAALAEYRPLVLQLGEQDVCAAAVTSLVRFSMRHDLVQWTSLAVAKLAAEFRLSVALGQADCCAVLIMVLTEHMTDEDVVEEIFGAISSLCTNSLENRNHFHVAKAEGVILKAIAKHEKSEAVVEAGLGALASMVQASVFIAEEEGEEGEIGNNGTGTANNSGVNGGSADTEEEDAGSVVPMHLDHENLLSPSATLNPATIVESIVYALIKHDGARIITHALLKHAAQQDIAFYGSKCLSDMALYGFYPDERRTAESVRDVTLPLRSPHHNNVCHITARNNTTQFTSSTRLEDLVLMPLGASSAPQAFTAVLTHHLNDVSIVQYALLALERIASCSRNLPVLQSAGVDILLISVLQTHHLNDTTIVNLCYKLITHFSTLDDCRYNLGKHNGPEVVLISIAHNMHDTLPAKLGADCISGMCVSPQFDAVSIMCSKDDVVSYDELEVNMRRSQLGDGTDRKPRSRASSEEVAQAVTEAQTSRTLGNLFGWSSNNNNNNNNNNNSSAYMSASTSGYGAAFGGGFGSKSSTVKAVPKVISTFEAMHKQHTTATLASTLDTLHGAFISKGLTDKEEELHTAKVLSRNQKSNTHILVKSGITTILLTILDKHARSYEVQISAINALNSIALDPEYRNDLNNEGIFTSLVKAYVNCLQLKNTTTSLTSTPSNADLIDIHTSHIDNTLANNSSIVDATQASSEVYTDIAARRVLLIILNVTIGTLCLPLTSEIEGVNSTNGNNNNHAVINQDLLGNSGVCELVVECLKRNLKDTLVCEATLRALFYLSRHHPVNQARIGACGGIELVIHSLRSLFYKPNIVYYACLCVAGLAYKHSDNCVLLDKCEVGNVIVKVLNIYMEQAEVVEAACYAVYALKLLNHRLGEACQLVVEALLVHAESTTVNQFAMQAIGSLSELRSNKVQLDKNNVCTVVTTALQRHVSSNNMLSAVFMRGDTTTSNAAVAQWGCTAIYYIARGTDSVDYQQKLVNAGACEAVTKALLKYSEYESIAYACFRSLVVLLMNNGAYKSKLGALGVCGCVVEAMHMFPYSAQVAKWGCRAVAVLAESHEANIARLGVAGACESIPVILQAHPTNEYVASAGCDVISFMSEVCTNGFAARFGQAGGCEAVVSVLRTHAGNAHVVTRASIAIASLSRVKGNATWMGPAGACDALMHVLLQHQQDVNVSKFIISAMGNLCIIDNNRERLGALGACEVVVSSARLHMYDLDTAKATALCMGKFCEHIYRTTEADESVAQNNHASGGNNNNVGMSSSITDNAAIEGGSDGTFELISSKHHALSFTSLHSDDANSSNASISTSGGVNSASVDTSRRGSITPTHSTSAVFTNAFANNGTPEGRNSPLPTRGTLSLPATLHINAGRRNRARLYECDYCTVLVELLSHHITNADAVRIISRTISIIAFGDVCSAERDVLHNVGACKALAKAMQYHEGDESIGRGVCWAIKALCYHHPRNREQLRQYGVCATILLVLRAFRYSKNATDTVQGAAAAIANLCQDNVLCKQAMGQAGACEGLLEIMELHHRNIEVAYLCSKALFHVVDGNQENNLKISFSGAADILYTMCVRYVDEERILDYLFSIMVGMCTGKVGQSRLGTVGVSKAVVSALYRYEKSSEYMVLLCCTLIQSLALNSSDNQNKLGSAGACKAIAGAAARYVRSSTFHQTNMKILQNRTKHSASGSAIGVGENMVSNLASSVLESDVTDVMDATTIAAVSPTGPLTSSTSPAVSVNALSDIIGEFSVLKECCKAVVYLSNRNNDNRSKLQSSGLLDTLTPVLSNAVPYRVFGENSVSGNISSETLTWVKSAVDVLMGKAT